ncbi:MAG: single-stranded DNA-binding protein [Bacteroidota bacterium]|jgi:single stranded DNA-binding protein (ssb)|nr:single-stranded DNA-binding protein [Bacteroidota bacterium]
MIKLLLTGALGSDCEVRETGNRKVINFRIAVNQDYKDAEGNKVEKTEWVKAVLWKASGQSTKIAEYLKKGQKVYIEGIPTSEAYESKEGGAKSSLVVNVKEIELLGGKS